MINQLLVAEPHAVVVSAHTGAGIDELLDAIEADLPRPTTRVDVVLPYERGDLLNQIHLRGEIETIEHEADGTHVVALVDGSLAHDLEGFGS